MVGRKNNLYWGQNDNEIRCGSHSGDQFVDFFDNRPF